MGRLSPIQFGAQSYQARSGTTNAERLVNLYLEQNPQTAKEPVSLIGTPGLKLWTTVGNGPIRGLHEMKGHVYAVSGTSVFKINSIKTATNLGTIAGAGDVQMTDNGTQVGIANGTTAYSVDSSGVQTLPIADLDGAAYQDGYGIFSKKNTQEFYITALDDMTTMSALDFSTADSSSDNLVGLISDHQELWLFGEHSTEIWYNAGAAAFPFVRIQQGVIERGCKAGPSIAKADNVVFWLGDDLKVYAAQGYQPQRISTHGIEKLIDGVNDPTTAKGFIYSQEGHTFYVLTFSDATIVYDSTTGLWHERKSDGIDRWRAQHFARLGDTLLVGDYVSGNIYELDLDYFTDNGSTLRREATSPPISLDGNRVFMHELHVDFETGVGITTGQGSAPEAMLDWSDDGGVTWSSELRATMGAIGVRKARAKFLRLGAFYQRTYRVAVSDPVKVVINGANARIEGGQT